MGSQQRDCQELYVLHLDRIHIERDLESLKHSVSFDKFDDVHFAEMMLRTAQVRYGWITWCFLFYRVCTFQRVLK